ncbi:MAG: hypothetical protein D6727_01600 [Gammaproteobacteria bacterium]|nr:MAG: hypothetical protein D6727_01600 [Gammaproteobacteria bacterium]
MVFDHADRILGLRRGVLLCASLLAFAWPDPGAAAPCNTAGSGSMLARAAAGLGPGQWCDFDAAETAGLGNLLAVSPGDGNDYVQWQHAAQWNPVARVLVWVGYDYAPISRATVVYKESSNSWTAAVGQPFPPGGNGHDYDQTVVDPATGQAYWRPRLQNTVYRGDWNGSGYSWSTGSVAPVDSGCADLTGEEATGMAWDASRGGIVLFTDAGAGDGRACFWDKASNRWSVDALVTGNVGSYHHVAEYDPVSQIVWMQGNFSNDHWKNAGGSVSKLSSTPPFSLGCCGSNGAESTPDPITGHFIVTKVVNGTRRWYEYDIVADRWSQIGHSMPPMTAGNADTNIRVIGGSISDHGVIMYVDSSPYDPQIYLYRHSAGGSAPVLPVVDLAAADSSVAAGGTTQLSWSSSDATSCSAAGGWSGSKPTNGSETVGPLSQDTTFILNCSNADGSTQTAVTVQVVGPPAVTLTASPASVVAGGSAVLVWSSTDASSCAASGGWSGTRPVSGSQSVGPLNADTSYTLTCSGAGGSDSASVTVTTDGQPGQSVILLFEDFENYADGADPAGWLDTGAGNSLLPDDARFHVVDMGGNKAFATSDTTTTNIHSHFAPGGAGWSNYDFVGRMQISGVGDSIGVTVLSAYPDADSYYRLRSWNGNSFELTTHGNGLECSGVTDTGVVPAPGQWYWFRVQAEDTGAATELRAKVWPEGAAEPGAWQASCSDSGTRRTTGTIGLWAVVSGDDVGSKYWDNLDLRTLGAGGPPPTLNLSATPQTVAYNGSATLDWSGSNITACTASGAWSGSRATSGSQTLGPLTASGDYTLICSSASGQSVTRTVTITVQAAPAPVLSLSAAPADVAFNGATTLDWSSSNADSCVASGAWSGSKPTSGSQVRSSLTQDSVFTLRCDGAGGQVSRSVTVTVQPAPPGAPPPPALAFTSSADRVGEGDTVTLNWNSSDANSCTASGDWSGAQPLAGSRTVGPLTATGNFTLSCSGAGGTVSRSLVVVVEAATTAPPVAEASEAPSGGGGGGLGWLELLGLLAGIAARRRKPA